MKRWWFGERKHIDEARVQARKQAERELAELIETGDEVAYIAYVRAAKPGITDVEMQTLVKLYHAERGRHPSDV